MANGNYYAYLVRIWRPDETAAWRFSLLNPHTGEVRHFSDWTQLVRFIEAHIKGGGEGC